MKRPLLINGFMGTGKSTVGRRVAELGGLPFVDLDARIEGLEGVPVAELFATRGEPAFRAIEARVLGQILDSGEPQVVALGGGALVERRPRLGALDRAVVVTLVASLDEILRRSAQRPGVRPLLAGADARQTAQRLLEQRELAYAECHGRVDTTGRQVDDVARDVLALWRRDPLAVAAGRDSYAVDVGAGVAVDVVGAALDRATRVIVVTDDNVGPLHARPVLDAVGDRAVLVEIPAGEAHKTLASAESIWLRAKAAGADRSSAFVGLGGGVVTDVAGFAAACWMRGVPWVAVPTTLLSMVDASVGGKTAVDLGPAKNCVGAFWQPRAVACDVALANTEPARGAAALSEVVKTALIGDAPLLDLLWDQSRAVLDRDPDLMREVVARCVRVKARVVSQDAREAGVRATLNLGHTIGHALEAVGGYDRLSHGEAVSLGLVAAAKMGAALGVTPAELVTRVVALLDRLGLPHDLSREPLREALELLSLDKKRRGSELSFIFARAAGEVVVHPLELAEVQRLASAALP